MSLSRWKMMAGVLGVSLGGLALAGQCPKTDDHKAAPPQPLPDLPMTASSTPTLPPPPAPSTTLPPLPTVPVATPAAPPVVIPAGGTTLPALPDLPATPPASGMGIPPIGPNTPPAPGAGELQAPSSKPTPPAVDPVGLPAANPPSAQQQKQPDPLVELPAPGRLDVTKPPAPPPVVPATATVVSKYRILLRVGEGEPTFEVRCGDELLLKVICEKVDVKSPEKGQGLSAVKASGKVRFAGFGAEGTCDELAFLAGTGEVGMSGHVKIQVKDKLGRVESELTTESMKYKIDPALIQASGPGMMGSR